MKAFDIILFSLFGVLIILSLLFVKTLKTEGSQCLVNPHKYSMEDLENTFNQKDLTCSCSIKGGMVTVSKENVTVVNLAKSFDWNNNLLFASNTSSKPST